MMLILERFGGGMFKSDVFFLRNRIAKFVQ